MNASFTPRRLSAPARLAVLCQGAVLCLGLAACGSTAEKHTPAPLAPARTAIATTQAWSAQVGESTDSMQSLLAGGHLFVATSSGTVAAINPDTGRDLWRFQLGKPLDAGIGADGQTAAVITRENELLTVVDGKERWRIRLPARSFTAPLVAGGRVFVLLADRSVSAFDGATGARLWTQTRPGEPLVLEQGGVLLAVGDTLVAGLSSRLTGLDPLNGRVRWSAPVANSRGTNEVERLNDLVGTVSRLGNSVCTRAFSAAVACVDADNGAVVWSKPAQGATGVGGDDRLVFGTESDGKVQAWQRADGAAAWTVDRLKFRQLSAPLAVGRVVFVGDSEGWVHVLSREDGSDMARLATDGSGIVGAPIVAGQVLVVQTRKGGLFAWKPQ